MFNSQHVVLVDEKNNILGIEDKVLAHSKDTKLHRGFSVYLFNSSKRLILQQRSATKITWPLFWSNSFCGHPQLHETHEQAVLRHSTFELSVTKLKLLWHVTDYRYRFTMGGNNIIENEICPIYLALSDDSVTINPHEVSKVQYLEWPQLMHCVKTNASQFTPWSKEQVSILNSSDIFQKFMLAI